MTDPLMAGEMQRTEEALRLPRPLEGYVGDHFVLDPASAYFAEWGIELGCLRIRAGASRP